MGADASIPSLAHKMYEFAAANGLQAEAETIRGMSVHPRMQDKYDGVRKAHLVELFESRNLLGRFVAECWPVGSTDEGQRKRQRWNARRERNNRLLAEPGVPLDEDLAEENDEQRFALETGLRDFLAHNLGVIEAGLRLYQDGERAGIEFPIDGGRGRIDVLALDAKGAPVVIELKLSRGRNATIGQLLYYMGWVDQHLGKGRSRGIIVAKDISDDLIVAVQRVPDVTLFRYKVAMTVEAVSSGPRDRA